MAAFLLIIAHCNSIYNYWTKKENEIDTQPIYIAFGAILTFFFGIIFWFMRRSINRRDAYRISVLNAVSNFYPDTLRWDESINGKIRNSVIDLEPIITDRLNDLDTKRRGSLRETWGAYKNECQKITYDHERAARLYGAENEIKPSDIVTKHIETLLKH